MPIKVAAAMSGGVDSSAACALLVEQGYSVIAMTLLLRPVDEDARGEGCCGVSETLMARRVAEKLGVPHFVVNMEQVFEDRVLRYGWEQYRSGRTPNPCVQCNRAIKFGALFDAARERGAEMIATGHHARLMRTSEGEKPRLLRGCDPNKDQSYFLSRLSPEQLSRTLFPIGHMTKTEVRETSRRFRLPNSEMRESQDACLASGRDGFPEALRLKFGGEVVPGDFIDPSGRVLGRHEGVHRYTIGQRKGLGIAFGERAFVSSIDADKSTVTLTLNEDDLCSDGLLADEAVFFQPPAVGERIRCEAQIRYRHLGAPSEVEMLDAGRVRVIFSVPQRAVTPGQTVAFYRGAEVLGAATISTGLRL